MKHLCDELPFRTLKKKNYGLIIGNLNDKLIA